MHLLATDGRIYASYLQLGINVMSVLLLNIVSALLVVSNQVTDVIFCVIILLLHVYYFTAFLMRISNSLTIS